MSPLRTSTVAGRDCQRHRDHCVASVAELPAASETSAVTVQLPSASASPCAGVTHHSDQAPPRSQDRIAIDDVAVAVDDLDRDRLAVRPDSVPLMAKPALASAVDDDVVPGNGVDRDRRRGRVDGDGEGRRYHAGVAGNVGLLSTVRLWTPSNSGELVIVQLPEASATAVPSTVVPLVSKQRHRRARLGAAAAHRRRGRRC